MRLKIDSIQETQREGQYGPYVTMSISSGGQYYSAIKKPWNASWKAGDVVEAEVETKGKYKNLKMPGKAFQASETPPDMQLILQTILTHVQEIRKLLEASQLPPV